MRQVVALGVVTLGLSGCIVSPAGPTYWIPQGTPGPEEEATGVVNGLWRYDETENRERVEMDRRLLTELEIEQLSKRYIVRVGLNRGFQPRVAEYAVLPDGWRYSQVDVVDDGHTVNVGDVVTVRFAKPRMVDYLVKIVRKCNSPAAESERREWNIGCVAIRKFDEPSGYGGNHYYFWAF